jgi:hypothetical protein
MTRSLYAIPVILCLAAGAVAAQAPAGDRPTPATPAAQQPTTPPAAQQPAKPTETTNKVTYTGCVKPGTAAGSWILENAEAALKPGASPSTVGTSGASKMAFNLNPASSVNLTPHANHKVEVVGVVSPAKPSADAPAAGAQAPRQQISVESVKMVSETCP